MKLENFERAKEITKRVSILQEEKRRWTAASFSGLTDVLLETNSKRTTFNPEFFNWEIIKELALAKIETELQALQKEFDDL